MLNFCGTLLFTLGKIRVGDYGNSIHPSQPNFWNLLFKHAIFFKGELMAKTKQLVMFKGN